MSIALMLSVNQHRKETLGSMLLKKLWLCGFDDATTLAISVFSHSDSLKIACQRLEYVALLSILDLSLDFLPQPHEDQDFM